MAEKVTDPGSAGATASMTTWAVAPGPSGTSEQSTVPAATTQVPSAVVAVSPDGAGVAVDDSEVPVVAAAPTLVTVTVHRSVPSTTTGSSSTTWTAASGATGTSRTSRSSKRATVDP